jgi:hypothetical protein
MTTTTPDAHASRELARTARVAEIQAGALTRAALGQAATYQHLDDGRHQVTIRGRTCTGNTLDAAIREVRRHG